VVPEWEPYRAIPALAPELGAIAGAMEDVRIAADRPREASAPYSWTGRRLADGLAGM
jgi:hypothetical protein